MHWTSNSATVESRPPIHHPSKLSRSRVKQNQDRHIDSFSVFSGSVGKKFFGRKRLTHDPRFRIEEYDTTRVPRAPEIRAKRLGTDSPHLDQGDVGIAISQIRYAPRVTSFRISLIAPINLCPQNARASVSRCVKDFARLVHLCVPLWFNRVFSPQRLSVTPPISCAVLQ